MCHGRIPAWGAGSFCCAHPGTAEKKERGEKEKEREEEEGVGVFN